MLADNNDAWAMDAYSLVSETILLMKEAVYYSGESKMPESLQVRLETLLRDLENVTNDLEEYVNEPFSE